MGRLTFLNNAKITIRGKITRTAILLLGKEESEHFINPSEAKIRWVLKDKYGNEKDYVIETCLCCLLWTRFILGSVIYDIDI